MGTLLEIISKHPGTKTAVIVPETDTRITYESLKSQVEDAAARLAALGIGKGDRIAMALPNGLPAVVCFLAAAVTGTAAPLNPAYRQEELEFFMEDTNARVAIVPSEDGKSARRAAAALNIPVLGADLNAEGLVGLSGGPQANGWSGRGPDETALVLHTSGSTGRPKRVPLKHRHLATAAENIAATYALTPDDVAVCVMPLFHVHGLIASTLATLCSGGTVVVPSKFNPLSFWRMLRNCRATWYSAVPTIHQLLLSRVHGNERRPQGTGLLRFIRSGSAPLAPETMKRMEEAFGAPVLEAYGMTEASHQIASNPLPPRARKPGHVGLPTGVQIGIMDAHDSLVTGESGEVVLRGPTVITGYESNPEANATSFVDGWFRTGDYGEIDSDGYLRLIARIKELINRGGEKVSPVTIDHVLEKHPLVVKAITFGVPHPVWGEEVEAAVVLNGSAGESDLIDYCREHLADFECPKKVHIVEEIPKTATGKIQRGTLARQLSEKRP